MAVRLWKSWASWIRLAICTAGGSPRRAIRTPWASFRLPWIYWENRGFVAPLRAFRVDLVADGCDGLAANARAAAPEPPPPEPYNQLDSNETLFYVLAAINAAGYDEQADSSTNNPLRGRVREYLAKQNLESLAAAEAFRAGSQTEESRADLGQYISFALWSKGAPDFTPANPDLPQPADADALYDFPPVLAAFYKEAKLGVLWQDAQPDYQRAIAQFHEPVVFAVQQVNAYLRHVDSGVRRGRFQILVDLMGAPNQVQFRNYIDDYYIIVTPAVEQPIFDIRHAYLRYQVDPLGSRFAEDLQKKASWACALWIRRCSANSTAWISCGWPRSA